MLRFPIYAIILLFLLLQIPSTVSAYTYGDPNQEEVAITFRDIAVKLGQQNPDWTAALELYKVRRSELESHFGANVASELDANFNAKDAKQVLNNFKGVLVMNLERRFTYSYQGIKDYAATKLLLAKAKGTYDILQPYVQEKLKPEEEAQVTKAFEKALDALGNPGVFGVGEKAAHPEEFKKQTDYIMSAIAPLFPFQGKAAGNAPAATAPVGDRGTAVHAPMERTNKTNPIVSIVVIGGVVIAVAGGFWYARRKGIF
jgi:hypothetical protein